MYSMYLVEDDDNIRFGLETFFDWQAMQIQLVGSAANGEDGFREILQSKADIVLTDVVMPGNTGLEMAKQLRDAGWNGALIFLSAYGDSAKLQAALRIHAADYVLKPFDDAAISEAIDRAKRKLEERDSYAQLQRAQRWQKILQGGPDDASNAKTEYALTLVVAETQLDEIALQMKSWGNGLLWADPCSRRETIGVWAECAAQGKILENAKRLETSLSEKFPSILLATSPVTPDVWRIPVQLAKLREMLSWGTVSLGSGNGSSVPMKQLARSILQGMRASDDENWVRGHDREIFDNVNSADVRTLRDLQDKCLVLVQLLAGILGKESLQDSCEKWRKKTSMLLMECESGDAVRQMLISGLQALHTLTFGHGEPLGAYARICAAVDGHLKEASLQWIMEQTNLTKWNLTKVIRSECGSTVNEWIQKLRIQEAIRLLLETNMKVYEIASEVGYATVDYFFAIFRGKMGISPEQYRIQNRQPKYGAMKNWDRL